MKTQTHTPEPEPVLQSLAELTHDYTRLSGLEGSLRDEEASLFQARQKTNSPPSLPMDNRERAIQAHIHQLMNGHSPPELLLPPAPSREEEIGIQRTAIRRVLGAIKTRMEDASEREAETWVKEHAGQWRELCRELVLAAVKLHSLEEKARRVLDEGLRGHWVGGLAMTQHVGGGYSLLGIGNPLMEMKKDAVREGVVSDADIRKAEKC